ncbi:MAG: hypothetical protein Q6361_03480 [Candidatus Hermodarchaeota archaeon]|nr:hypothetical protein [Candidatus Hermodarchaeota archaeon]
MTGLLELSILGKILCPQAVGSQAMISWAMMDGFQTSWSAD